MKISKQIIAYLIILSILSIEILFLKPYIKGKYFDSAITNFQDKSWKYPLLLMCIILIIQLVSAFRKKTLGLKIVLIGLANVAIFTFCLKFITDDILLFTNTKIGVDNFEKTYTIGNANPAVLYRKSDSEIILLSEEIAKVDALRKQKKIKLLNELKPNDTVKINYKIGFLNVQFLP